MNKSTLKVFSAIILSILALGLLPITAYAASSSDVVIGSSYILQNGETLNDNLFILGGSVDLQSGSLVTGDIILLGGSMQAAGTVNGNIIAFGGTLTLASTFVLNGDLSYAGASVTRQPGAQINGQINTGGNGSNFVLPGGVTIPTITSVYNPVFKFGGFILRLILWALVAMLVAMFLPVHLSRTSQTAFTQPLISGGLGCLTAIIVPVVLIILAITICLIPVALVGALILVIAWAFGLIAVGVEVGKRIAAMFKQDWHPAIIAGAGTLLLMLVLDGVNSLVPCVGWIPVTLVGLVGLGAVLLTQFGSKPYNPAASLPAGSFVEGSLPSGDSTDTSSPPASPSA